VEVFSEAEFSLELRIISLRVRVRRQRAAASAEEKKKISIIKIAKASLLMYLRKKFFASIVLCFFDNSCDHFPTHSKYFQFSEFCPVSREE
jgi:hypothetical protein